MPSPCNAYGIKAMKNGKLLGRVLLGLTVSGWMGWLGLCVLLGKNRFWLSCLKWLKNHLLDYVA